MKKYINSFVRPHNPKQWRAFHKDVKSKVGNLETEFMLNEHPDGELISFFPHLSFSKDNKLVLTGNYSSFSKTEGYREPDRDYLEKWVANNDPSNAIEYIRFSKESSPTYKDVDVDLVISDHYLESVLGKPFKEYVADFADMDTSPSPVTNYLIKNRDGEYGDILCVSYRKRMDDYNLRWVNESWVVDNATLRFKTSDDAKQFLRDNPQLQRGKFGPSRIGESRKNFNLVEVKLDPYFVSNALVYVADTYVIRHVNK